MRSKADNFFLMLVAAVVLVTSIYVLGKMTWWSDPINAEVRGAKTERVGSPSELMKRLNGTVDDKGEREYKRLENGSTGL